MSMGKKEAKKEAAAPAAQTTSASALDEILSAMPKTVERGDGEDLIRGLVDQVQAGVVKYDKSLTNTIRKAIAQLDATISQQLSAVLHHPDFQKLEGSWRGLNYLVMNSETCETLKIRVLNLSKRDLFKDLDKAIEFDQSQLFKKIYETEYGMPGGQPYGALIGDYEITNHPEDMATLEKVSQVAAAAFCPFISAASPTMFGLEQYTELSRPRDLSKIFDSKPYIKWNAFREQEDSRFVTLVLPRVLARSPYGSNNTTVEEFQYEEVAMDDKGRDKPMNHDDYCWMNAAYVHGARLTDAFAKTNWCTAIRGAENGGKVEGLPCHIFTTDEGDPDLKCPTEIGITDRRDAELSKLGFLALGHYKNKDYAVFFGGQTCQKPKKYDKADATANAAISARLPYMMATSRIAHYLKCMARDKIGAFFERQEMQDFLNRWIAQYVLDDPKPTAEMKAKYPLAEARIEVTEIPGKPGAYNAVAWLRPWLQLEELNASLRMVASLPKKAS